MAKKADFQKRGLFQLKFYVKLGVSFKTDGNIKYSFLSLRLILNFLLFTCTMIVLREKLLYASKA